MTCRVMFCYSDYLPSFIRQVHYILMLCYVFPLYSQLNSKIFEALNIKNVVSSGYQPQTFGRVSLQSHPSICFS